LTATLRPPGHNTTVAHASLTTHSPSGAISPISSASGMKVPGTVAPRLGCRQRLNASNLLMSLVQDRQPVGSGARTGLAARTAIRLRGCGALPIARLAQKRQVPQLSLTAKTRETLFVLLLARHCTLCGDPQTDPVANATHLRKVAFDLQNGLVLVTQFVAGTLLLSPCIPPCPPTPSRSLPPTFLKEYIRPGQELRDE